MLKQKILFSILAEITIYSLGFFSLIFVVRVYGPKTIGLVTSALAIGNIFGIFGNLGFGVSHVKLVSQGEDLNECISSYIFIKFMTIPLMIITFTIFSYLFPHSSLSYFNFEDKSILLIIFIGAIITSISDIWSFTLSAQLRIATSKLVLIFQKIISSAGKILVSIFSLSAIYLASIETITIIVGLVIYIIIFREIKIKYPNKNILKKYFNLSFSAFIITITSVLMSNNLDRVILLNYSGSEEVGYYSTSLSLMVFFTFIANNLNNILFPHFSKLFSENKIEIVAQLVKQTEKIIILFILPITLLIYFNSREIVILIFGEKMINASPIISLLSIQFFIILLNRPFTTQIVGFGKFKLVVFLDLLLLTLTIILLFIFIPDEIFGIKVFNLKGIGAAFSSLISYLILHVLYRLFANKITHTGINLINLYYIIIGITVNLLYVFLLKSIINNMLLIIVFSFIINYPIYLFVLYKLKILDKKEINAMIDFLNLSSLKNYVLNELTRIKT